MTEKYDRLVIIRTDGEYVNIPVSRIERDDCIVCAYRGDELVGIIDLGFVHLLYISERKDTGK